MATVRVIGQRAMNLVLKDLSEVKEEVYSHAQIIAAKAEANLARHRDTGKAHIEIERGDVDSYVALVDDAAMSIEFGHWYVNGKGKAKHVPGLYVLTRAAGII